MKWQDFFISTYWFINAIVICYVLYFFYVRFFLKYGRFIFSLFGVALVLYFIGFTLLDDLSGIIIESPSFVSFRWFYLFQIMLLGGYCASAGTLEHSRKRDLGLMLVFLLLYYAYKGICIKYDLYWGQLLTPVFLICTIFYMVKVCAAGLCRRNIVNSFLQKYRKFFIFISTLTLDIYLVQFVVIRYFSEYKFPVGFIGATIVIFIAAIILNKLSRLFYDRVMVFVQKII